MEQHAVPQDITGFQFKLVGDWTLKQFGELAFGIIIAYIIASTSWHPLIKWPLTVLFGLLGIGLAFVPIEERPLDIWIINFFRAIYKPTYYIWKKSNTALETPPNVTAAPIPREATAPMTIPPRESPTAMETPAVLEKTEEKIPDKNQPPEEKWPFKEEAQKQTAYVYVPSAPTARPDLGEGPQPVSQSTVAAPPEEVKTEPIYPTTTVITNDDQTPVLTAAPNPPPVMAPPPPPATPIPTTPTAMVPPPEEPTHDEAAKPLSVEELLKRRGETATQKEETFQQKALSVEDLVRMRTEMTSVKEEKTATDLSESETKLNDLIEKNKQLLLKIDEIRNQMFSMANQDVSGQQTQLDILLAQKGELAPQIAAARDEVAGQRVAPVSTPAYKEPVITKPTVIKTEGTASTKAISLTNIPNVINGLVLDNAGNPINGVILLLKDDKGNSIRALRTNKVGQFIASTPVANGTYYLELEKEGFEFETWEVMLKGEILPPVEIRAKQQTEEPTIVTSG